MNTILPDQVLDLMICSNCSKYLSVLPVHMYPNRSMKCGRCIEEDDNGALSQVNKVFPTMLFKCVNRYEGCTSLLLPDQVKEHEENCVSKSFDICPLCPDSNMPPYMMLEHYRKKHRYFLLKKPIFQINATVDSEKYYLYCTDNMMFMLNISVDTVNNKIFLDNRLVGPEDLAKKISHKFRILDGLLYRSSEFQQCDTVLKKRFEFSLGELDKMENISCELILNFDFVQFGNFQVKKKDLLSINYMANKCFSRKLYLTPKFKELYPGLQLSICGMYAIDHKDNKMIQFCSYCGENLYSKTCFIYNNCSEPIVSCDSCKNDVNQSCSKGHKPVGCINNNEHFLNIRAYCKWKCGQHFDCFNLFRHEEDCVNREPIPSCPVENCSIENFKNFSKLKTHFKSHENTILIPYWDNKWWFSNMKTNSCYVYLDHVTVVFCKIDEEFKLKNVIKTDLNSKLKVFVNDVQIELDEQIKKPNDGKPIKIRVIEDFEIECKN